MKNFNAKAAALTYPAAEPIFFRSSAVRAFEVKSRSRNTHHLNIAHNLFADQT